MSRLPRLLAGIAAPGGEAHLDVHGPFPAPAHPRGLIDSVARAGLRGRGGAAFPTARKMAAVARTARRPIVVANGAETEPASEKDRLLLERCPHLVLDGLLLAARSVGAREAIVGVNERAPSAIASVERALVERDRQGLLPVPTQVIATPALHLAGQESALIRFINEGDPRPSFVPPRPFERGVDRCPTLVQNVETLAHLALVARHGPEWFREAGTLAEPGTALVTLSGAVAQPGVYEVELGTPLPALLDVAGGIAGDEPRAVLLGGYFGSWVGGRLIGELHLCEEALRPYGASLGSGVIVVLGARACPVAETVRVASYLAEQSAGQCGPCANGLPAIAGALARLAAGRAEAAVDERLARWSAIVPGRGACHHPDGTVRFVTSALEVFADEFESHRRQGPCARCAAPPVLPVPEPDEPAVAA